MEQRNKNTTKHEHPFVLTVWRHSCIIHGEHVAAYGSDCPDTVRINARALYQDCARQCDWVGLPKEYSLDPDMPGLFGDKLAGEDEAEQ